MRFPLRGNGKGVLVKRLWMWLKDVREYSYYGFLMVRILLLGVREIKLSFRLDGEQIYGVYFDPTTVRGEMRVVEKFRDEENFIRFRRGGKSYADTADEAAYEKLFAEAHRGGIECAEAFPKESLDDAGMADPHEVAGCGCGREGAISSLPHFSDSQNRKRPKGDVDFGG